MSETTATSRAARPAPGARPPPRPAGRCCDRLLLVVAVVVLLALPFYVEEFWLRTGFAVFGGDGRRDRAEPAGREHRPAVARARVLPGRRRRHLRLRVRRVRRHRARRPERARAATAARHDRRRARGRPRRPAVQPDRRTAAGHLPRCRLAGPGLHRPARAQQLDLGDRRLQRTVGTGVLAVRLHLRQHATPTSSCWACPSGRPSGSGTSVWCWRWLLPVRAEPAAQPARTGAADPAGQRGRGVGHGRQRPALQGARLPREFDVRGSGRRDVRAVHRQHRAGVLRARVVGPVPRDDRPRRSRVGRRSVLGAVFVSALPLVFQRYADVVPFVGSAGEGGLAPGEAARYFFGLAIILVVMFEPAGLAGLAGRFRRKGRDPGGGRPSTSSHPSSSTTDVPSDRPAQGSTS